MQIQQNKGNENAHNQTPQNTTPARQYRNPHSPYQTKEGAKPVIQAKQRPVDRSQAQVIQHKSEGQGDSKEIIPGDFYNEKGHYLGSDGKNDNNIYIVEDKADRKKIKKNHKKGIHTQVKDVKSARLISTAAGLDEALDVLKRTQGKTASDDEGGKHEESSIVLNDNTVVRGKSGAKVKYKEGAIAETSIPKLPEGLTEEDVAVLIHSHPTVSEIIGNTLWSFSAKSPTDKDATNAFTKYKINIIAGRLGNASVRKNQRGEVVPMDKALGIAIYDGNGASVDLTIPQVKRILKNQIKRGKYQKK